MNSQPINDPKENLLKLQQRWKNKDFDMRGKRLEIDIVRKFKDKDSEVMAILANDAKVFDEAKLINAKPDDIADWFVVACLCKSDQITNALKPHVQLKRNSFALAYALSTGDDNFALDIADWSKDKLTPDSAILAFYNQCKFSTLQDVKGKFNLSENPTRKIKLGHS